MSNQADYESGMRNKQMQIINESNEEENKTQDYETFLKQGIAQPKAEVIILDDNISRPVLKLDENIIQENQEKYQKLVEEMQQ